MPSSTSLADARPSCSSSRVAERDELGVGARPQAVALEAEVLEAQARLARLRHHRPAPVVEVLDAADLHARRVDVDPVVGKQVVALQHQRDHEEVAVPEALGGRAARLRRRLDRARAPARAAASSRSRDRPRNARSPSGVSARTRRDAAAVASRLPSPGGRSSTWLPSRDDAIAAALPTSGPGPRRGYWNSLISVLIAVDRLLSDAAVEDRLRERQALDALGGPLGADLGARDAPDLLRVGLEEDLVQPLAEPVGDPLLEVLLDRVRAEVPLDVARARSAAR